MSVTHMQQFARWGNNSHSIQKEIEPIGEIKDYVVYHIPRSMFRKAASTFGDVRHADSDSRYDEITLQLFLQMLYESATIDDDKVPCDKYPYMKVWLEWIPSITLEHNAVGYNLHAVSFHDDIQFGKSLSRLLFETNQTSRESMNRKLNCRKQDPLSGLHPFQKWMRVSSKEMYVRTICDRYDKSQMFTNMFDDILNPKKPLFDGANCANPKHVFNIDRCMKHIPDTAQPAFRDRTSYTNCPVDGVCVLQFPSPEHVRLLTSSQLHPKIFCSKYLPDYQHWLGMDINTPSKQLDDDYDDTCQTEYDTRTPADIERARLDGMSDRSAFSSLSVQSRAKYNTDCLEKEHTDEFPAAYHKFQEWSIREMKHQCLDPDACISDVVSKMILWRDHHKEAATIRHRLTDPSLSVFANRVIGLMEGFEQYYLISTAHRMMFLIHHARYDAFRRDFGLHFNCFQAGDGATSKSFLFGQMEKSSIQGTIEVLTYQTGKADAVDGNRNDIVTVCHEAPPGMFRTGKNPNADSTQEAMFKEKLTSQRVTAKIWCMDEGTGRRSARVTKSECIGVWMGATNDPPSEVEEALKTRFFWGNFEQQQRRGRDIDDCMNGERMMSTADKAIRKRMFLEAKEEQSRVMLVEKAIWCGAIKDVNMTACNILVPRLKAKITRNSIICPTPRDWDRVKIFSRLMAIVTAIERVCNLPGGEYYDRPFDEECIPTLEPFLRVTEEMVIFTLSLLSDQFRSPVEHKILNAIYTMEKRAPKYDNPNDNGNDKSDFYDYIKLPKLKQLSKKITSRIPLQQGRPSPNNIENFLLNMGKHSGRVPKYKLKQAVSGTTISEDKFSQLTTAKGKRIKQSCIITGDGVWIHISHLLSHREDSIDSVFQILSSETHAHSDNKRILTACPVNSTSFHVFRVIERAPKGRTIKYKNVLANSKTSRWITSTESWQAQTRTEGDYKIDEDIDRRVCKDWATKIGKATYTPSEICQNIVSLEDYGRPHIRYPDDLLMVDEEEIHSDEEEEEVSTKRKRNEEEGEPSSKQQKL